MRTTRALRIRNGIMLFSSSLEPRAQAGGLRSFYPLL